MSSQKKNYLITILIGLACALAVFFGQGGFAAGDGQEMYRRLCDAFFVPGVLLVCVGLLIFSSNGGTFDIFRYGISRVTVYFWSREKRESMPRTYYEYAVERRKKPARRYGFLLITGGAMLALSVVFLILCSM